MVPFTIHSPIPAPLRDRIARQLPPQVRCLCSSGDRLQCCQQTHGTGARRVAHLQQMSVSGTQDTSGMHTCGMQETARLERSEMEALRAAEERRRWLEEETKRNKKAKAAKAK